MTVISGVSSDKTKIVKFNKMMRKDSDSPSWKANISDNPLVEAFPESIDIHPGLQSSPIAPAQVQSTLSDLTSRKRTRRTVAYINVPYCETRCLYCLFYIKPYRNKEESKAYADTLIKELQLWADKPIQQNEPVHAVYFGGGTPTALEATDIERVIKAVRQYLPLANDCEITYEGRLSGFDVDKMEAAVQGGANRFSLGVQTFDTKVRQAVGRRSTKEQLISQLSRLTRFNQAAVVIDLIYGFPFQTMETWKEDLAISRELNLDGVDCYQLRVFERSPLFKYIANGKLPAGPNHELRAHMFAEAVQSMREAGWSRLSISHWAANTRERNFYNYYAKTRSDCLAYGPGAGGNIDGYAYMMDRTPDSWKKAVGEGIKPVSMMLDPAPHWQLCRAVAEQLELNFLDPSRLAAEFTPQLLYVFEPLVENWTQAGLLSPIGTRYELTVAGQFWQGRMTQHLLNQIKSLL